MKEMTIYRVTIPKIQIATLIGSIILVYVIRIQDDLKLNVSLQLLSSDQKAFYKSAVDSSPITVIQSASLTATKKQDRPLRQILFYTKFFGSDWRPNIDPELEQFCPHCKVTRNTDDIKSAHVVVFHTGSKKDMPSVSHLRALKRPSYQKWIYLNQEPPINGHSIPEYRTMFNWSCTVNYESDFPLPYGSYQDHPADKAIHHIDFASKRRNSILWIVSNCRTIYRNNIFFELRKYVPFDIYGDCSAVKLPRGEDGIKIRRLYKIYFAVENSVCPDYISEKYWNALRDGMIPIVLDEGNYRKLAIPNSYIDINQFKSLEDLGHYIQSLLDDMTAFKEFFKWRESYDPFGNNHPLVCSFCEAFDDSVKGKHGISHYQEFYDSKFCIPNVQLDAQFKGGSLFRDAFHMLLWWLVLLCVVYGLKKFLLL